MTGIDGIFNLLILGLATSQVVEVMNHSRLSLPLRKWAVETAPVGGVRGFFAKLIGCPFCFSHWVAGGFTLLLFLALWHYWPIQLLAMIFAATRVANLSNDVLHDMIRTPKHEIVEEEYLEVDEGKPDEALGKPPGGSDL